MRCFAALMLLATVIYAGPLRAQEPDEAPDTLETRVNELERKLASLEARLAARIPADPGAYTAGDGGVRTQAALDRMEREIAGLTNDVQRVEREAQAARREANEAQRAARNALNVANRAGAR